MEIIKERTVKIEKEYYINFDRNDDPTCGFVFPANSDESPALDKMPEEAKRNYFECEANPDKFNRWFEEREVKVVEPAIGRCTCGSGVDLDTDFSYHGAVRCEKCGQWYNIFGQKLIDPEYWEEDDDDYDEDPTDGFMGITAGSINY